MRTTYTFCVAFPVATSHHSYLRIRVPGYKALNAYTYDDRRFAPSPLARADECFYGQLLAYHPSSIRNCFTRGSSIIYDATAAGTTSNCIVPKSSTVRMAPTT